ncbi:MAG: DNA helicase UvrD [Deltaproteobacteria bacterium]|nr:DNA helicase UvrD [Deltaproteobacteria bacterium]
MRLIADLHIHSGYSRATSKEMNLPTIARWARLKGIDVVGTGDFTHPAHFASIKELLEPSAPGLFRLRKEAKDARPVHFMLTAEVSSIWTQGGRTRKVHTLVFAPDMKTVERINKTLASIGNIASDGRPILGLSAYELAGIVFDASAEAMVVPAHAWTPWFSIFGSKSGFDSIEECFGDLSRHIFAIETGLSSNPAMNRRLSSLDRITLISNSDAHSPAKLGREANVFDANLDYYEIRRIMKERDTKHFPYTIEFYPEEGKYHCDGHRECGVLFTPQETKRAKGVCPVCGRGVTVGVLSRVEALADRPENYIAPDAPPTVHLVPLEEILAQAFECGVNTKKVKHEYERLIAEGGSEFDILLWKTDDELSSLAGKRIAEGILRARNGNISIVPGFDGEFGKINIYGRTEAPHPARPVQGSLL